MNKKLLTLVLTIVLLASGQPATCAAQSGQSGSASKNAKVIKDATEYNAYITALNTQDPAAKAAAMEAFVRQYPNSVVFIDALEQAMAAYQQVGDRDKVEETARRILQRMPNVRALAIVVALDRFKATRGDQPALAESCSYSQNGLQQLPNWQKPEAMSDADFEKLRDQMGIIFNGAAGFCALQAKNYPAARDALTKVVQADPTSLQDVYQLAVAELQMNPMDVNGLWYCGKAIGLAQHMNNAQVVNGIVGYCKAKYRRYHGGEDGWDQLVAAASGQNTLPADFAKSIKPAPTPCELAVQAVQQNDPATLSFSDREYILGKAGCSPDNKVAADKVWRSIQDMQKGGAARLKLPEVKIISATRTSIDAAITDDNKTANKADLHVVMEKPMLHPPAAGTTTDVVGVITTYTPDPFLFTMEHGELPASKTP